MNLKEHHKKYLRENNLNSITDVAFHIERLKESGENRQMMLGLVWILVNEKSCLLDFFAENNPAYNKQVDLVNQLAFNLKQNRINATRLKAENMKPIGYQIVDKTKDPVEIYTFSWRPSQKTESTLNVKPVYSNPWNDVQYCPRKERIKDTEKEKEKPYYKLDLSLNYDSPLSSKQKDKVTTEDLKVFKNPVVKDCTIKDGKVEYGVKDNQKEQKAPIFTFCNQMKNAVEALAFRSLYGHERYKKYDEDWQNFSRVPNGDFEYSNAEFRHALGMGADENEEQHLVASAWNSIARLEIFLRNKK